MRQCFDPATCVVMLGGTTQRFTSVKLDIKKSDAPFYRASPGVQKLLFFLRIFDVPVAASIGSYRDALFGELGAFLGFGPIGVISKEMPLEGSFEQGIKSVDVMPVAGDLDRKGNPAFWSEDQMFTDSMEPAFQRGTIPCSGKSAEPFLFACPNGAADIDGVRIDDEKGGFPSPSISTNAWERRWMSGVRRARRSAQLGRLKRRGNNFLMVGWVPNHW